MERNTAADQPGFTRCVFCITPAGWGWLPVSLLPVGQITGEWVANEELIPSPVMANEGDHRDPAATLGPFPGWSARQIPADRIQDFLFREGTEGQHLVGDSTFGITPDMGHGR